MLGRHAVLLWVALLGRVWSLIYEPEHVGWNLNENQAAVDPLDYWGEWANHTFNPSPSNWRFPFMILTLDRYADGDPTNNEANGTVFEHDWMSDQFRFGGDARGLMNHLDYIQGFGIKGIYLSGSPFINEPWASDGFGPLDFTLLDHHHGVIEDWRALITEMHSRGMYVILDNTLATMGNLLAFADYENATTPFTWEEHDVMYKSDRRYLDFQPGNSKNSSCQYPTFWGNDGYPVGQDVTQDMDGCRISEFDQYGDMKGVGAVVPYQSQLSKFAGVQDRLRAYNPDVLEKIKHFSCMEIAMLDIDGFRVDKALQTPLDAHADWSAYQRECARRYGKENFLVVGESVGEKPFSALFFGRGKRPDQAWKNLTEAQLATNETDPSSYLREFGTSALDGEAFHYPTYGAMTRFLGLDGSAIGINGVDFVAQWNEMILTNDMVNSNTGEFDPRHMFGMTNQDVFRWPSLANGTHRQLLGFFITTLEMPGIPMLLWGEEQEHKILENLASDYVFGRQPMSSSRAWQLHGCYKVGATGYYDLPIYNATYACQDDGVSLDHKDPSHPVRNILKRMYELRQQYPTLNDGYKLQTLSTQIHNLYLPGSAGMPSPTGIWSVYRGRTEGVQDFSTHQGNQGVWLVFSNDNVTKDYSFDCSNQTGALLSPFAPGTTVKNLFYPYEEFVLEPSTVEIGLETPGVSGCLSNMLMRPWEYKAFVPKAKFVQPAPTITKVIPSHDSRLISTVPLGGQQSVAIEVQFSQEMDCGSVSSSLLIDSNTQDSHTAQLNASSVTCGASDPFTPDFVGGIGSAWSLRAELVNVSHGVHTMTVKNATAVDNSSTNAVDRFMFRIGQDDNPMVFPATANYTRNLLHKNPSGLYVTLKAAGAEKWRYSTNWGSSYSQWLPYTSANTSVEPQAWTGTSDQAWSGDHIITQYWSDMTGSSDHVQHADLDPSAPAQRWPHVHLQGVWNQFGYDGGLADSMTQDAGNWFFDLMTEWPTQVVVNVWGMNPDGAPDKSMAYGDVDGDNILDWVPPDSLAANTVNVTQEPAMPHLGWRFIVDDGNNRYWLEPTGSAWTQIVVYILLALVPIVTGCGAVFIFVWSFYRVKFNEIGIMGKKRTAQGAAAKSPEPTPPPPNRDSMIGRLKRSSSMFFGGQGNVSMAAISPEKRTVLIATMEYEIEDWKIKIKIGGLGVMASLMGKNLEHQNLIWVVPCVGDVDYPTDRPGEPMRIVIMGNTYEISVQYHVHRNITFVLLDAPVFRQQTKAEPYPSRMDDIGSAIYYSAWNACIAEAINRFPGIDLYHINDYHGALAPLHLLPRVVPVCLSLHNAEFQGLWSLNTPAKLDELSSVFNLDKKIIKTYVQFGDVFNLLHAGASYLRKHQNGFGAVGVSKKYGKRSFARYPIFWGLSKIGALPNPDPSDTAEWDKQLPRPESIVIDTEQEAQRGALRRQAQEWAGLNVDEKAELFVFVGRWSQQKGVDLIADVFPAILKERANTQLICIGPVIDLYGKFAALKLNKLMQMYPDRVFSKPEFTALPPYLFSGAEFSLIPSRDEPFGLVAVEFGRKGALGVGARVGGLGQMPGWWFTVESTTTKHLLSQLKGAIKGALESSTQTRAMMRARSSKQRFPVAQWIEDLEILQMTSIKMHRKVAQKRSSGRISGVDGELPSGALTAPGSVVATSPNSEVPSRAGSRPGSHMGSRVGSRASSPAREITSHSQILQKRLDQIRRNRTGGMEHSLNAVGETDSTDFGSETAAIRESSPSRNGSTSSGSSDANRSSGEKEQRLSTNGAPRASPCTLNAVASTTSRTLPSAAFASPSHSPSVSGTTTPAASYKSYHPLDNNRSTLSLHLVIGEQKGFKLQEVDPSFTDPTGLYTRMFERMLFSLDSKNSENQLCIEEYLAKSEKNWFGRFYDAKLGRSTPTTPASSLYHKSLARHHESEAGDEDSVDEPGNGQFMIDDKYAPPRGVKKLLQYKVGDWPIYAFFLAFGQIIAANSYQITLITGENGQSAAKLYVVASVYLAGSIFWWACFRMLKSVYVLSLPFLFYGSAFFVLGMTPYGPSIDGRGWIQNVATGLYALASASGSFFFALNFGSEGGSPTATWIFRACVLQGTQQIYVAVLWYWGAYLTSFTTAGGQTSQLITSGPMITAITAPIAVFLWAVGLLVFFGLPSFYRSSPGRMPSFYPSIYRRKVVLWFFIAVLIQNYWLSAPYGRNWRYLWSSSIASPWMVAVLVVFFFVVVWASTLWLLGHLSKEHSWLLPIFAIGLGAPRWCQLLWGTSGIGQYVPWAGSQLAGALLGRSLWLWLGVLDALQGVGFGMILLQTLTRFHITFTLVAAQVLGSIATIAARATAPDNVGPGSVFPNFGLGSSGLGQPWFWVALLFQLVICVGFLLFFRKEQLTKP